MDQQSETELRERDDRAPEHEPAETAADARAEPDEAAPEEEAEPPKKKRSLLLVGLLIAAGAVAGGGYLYFSTRDLQSTDDAYTDGRAVTIAPQVSGLVVSLDVNDNQFVHKGEALIHIDPRQYIQERDSAQGTLDLAKAQLAGLKLGAEIARKNFPAQLDQAKAQLASAQAAEARAEADISNSAGSTVN